MSGLTSLTSTPVGTIFSGELIAEQQNYARILYIQQNFALVGESECYGSSAAEL